MLHKDTPNHLKHMNPVHDSGCISGENEKNHISYVCINDLI